MGRGAQQKKLPARAHHGANAQTHGIKPAVGPKFSTCTKHKLARSQPPRAPKHTKEGRPTHVHSHTRSVPFRSVPYARSAPYVPHLRGLCARHLARGHGEVLALARVPAVLKRVGLGQVIRPLLRSVLRFLCVRVCVIICVCECHWCCHK